MIILHPEKMPESDSHIQIYDEASYARIDPERSVHQHSDRIFHNPTFRYDEVDAVISAEISGQTLSLRLSLASSATALLLLHFVDPAVIRLQLSREEEGSTFDEESDMLVPFKGETVKLSMKASEGGWNLSSGSRELQISQKPFHLKLKDRSSGRVLFQTEYYELAGKPLVGTLGFRQSRLPGEKRWTPYISWKQRNGERFFGLGEKWNRVKKNGSRATIWASDTCGSNSNDLSYKSLPYLLSSEGWGAFLHSSFRSLWEVGSFSYVSGSCATEDDKLDLFLFLGPRQDYKSLIERYTALTGRPRPVPDWALGLWMSRCQYKNATEAEAAMEGLRNRGIPADVIHLDPLWMKTHYYFRIGVDACDFVRNDENFPDLPGLWKKWRANGFKTCLWVNPYLPEGTAVYDYARESGYLLKSTKGGLARLSHGEPVGMIDFSNPEAKEWWKGQLKKQLRDGAAVLKPDYGDRVPEDALFANGKTGKELHNMFLFWFTETCYEAAQEVYGYGLVWRRAGYIGSQRYPGTWAGDTRSTWEEMLACLRGGLSAGFHGEAFWAGDIGGFTGEEPSPELYIRWSQWGLLSPLARFHGANCPREPWYFGDKAVEVVRNYARLRYQLMPYLKKCADETYQRGVPIMRHMHLEYPLDPVTENVDDQFMLGPDLMVAPIFEEGAVERLVYLPAGSWQLVDATLRPLQCSMEGERFCKVSAPLERIPLFVRADADLPLDKSEKPFIE